MSMWVATTGWALAIQSMPCSCCRVNNHPLALNTYRILHKFQSQALYSKDPYHTIWRAGRCASLIMSQNLKPNKSRFSHSSCSTAGQVPPLLCTSWAGSYGCLVHEPCLEVEILLLSCQSVICFVIWCFERLWSPSWSGKNQLLLTWMPYACWM